MTNARLGGNGKWRCTTRAYVSGTFNSGGCSNTAKHDPDENGNPTKCGVHSSAAKARRDAKSKANHEKWRAEHRHKNAIWNAKNELIPLVRSIADGHNDPRQACKEWLDRWEQLKEEKP